MPTRQNRYFNSPHMAAAFSNLAGLFAPPSAQDFYAMSRTEGQDFQNQAIRQAWEAMSADGVTPQTQDRFGIAATLFGQGFNPTQSNRAVDIASADRRYGVDVGAQTSLATNAADNDARLRQAILGAATNYQGSQAVDADLLEAITGVPGVALPGAGPVAPTDAQVLGGQTQRLIDSNQITDDMLVAQAFGSTPVQTFTGPDGQPIIGTRPQALGQAPVADAPDMGNVTRFLIPDETGEMSVVSGFTMPDGRILMPDGTDITALNPIPASNSGGTQFEVGPDGQVRISMGMDGLTNRTTGVLQGSRESALRLNRSMTSLFENLTPGALGFSGLFNDQIVNRLAAQFIPNAANLPVAAQRTQLESVILREARGILDNDRLNREDRERIARLMPDPTTVFESYPRARTALATIATYAAYDAAFADARLQGETLPPINPQIIGQLVDQGILAPNVAQAAISALFPNRSGVAPAAPTEERSIDELLRLYGGD